MKGVAGGGDTQVTGSAELKSAAAGFTGSAMPNFLGLLLKEIVLFRLVRIYDCSLKSSHALVDQVDLPELLRSG